MSYGEDYLQCKFNEVGFNSRTHSRASLLGASPTMSALSVEH